MTDLVPVLVVLVPAIPLVGAGLALLARTTRQADRLAMVTAVVTAVAALILACTAFARGGRAALHGRWYLLDGASGLLLAVIAVVGLCSALVSPSYLRTSGRSWTTAARSRSLYYAALFVFWAALLAVPVTGNLAVVWLIVEATTAASALLVAFTGRRRRARRGLEVPRPDDSRSVGRAARDYRAGHRPGQRRAPRPARARLAHAAARRSHAAEGPDADRVRAAPGRSRGQDRVGSRPQLAARCAQRGAGADQRAAVRGAASDRVADRLAREADPRALRGRGHHACRVHRLRIDLDARRDPVSVAVAAVEAAAGVFEPRAHGGDRARASASARRSRSPVS